MKMIVPQKVNPEQVPTDHIMMIGLNERREVGRVIPEDVKTIIVIHLHRLHINTVHITILRRQKQKEEGLIEDLMG